MEKVTRGQRHTQKKKWRESEADTNHYHMRAGAAGNTEDTECQLLWKKKDAATLQEEDVQLYLATAVRIANMCSWLR